MSRIMCLPIELIVFIFSFLKIKEQQRLKEVCKSWYTITTSEDVQSHVLDADVNVLRYLLNEENVSSLVRSTLGLNIRNMSIHTVNQHTIPAKIILPNLRWLAWHFDGDGIIPTYPQTWHLPVLQFLQVYTGNYQEIITPLLRPTLRHIDAPNCQIYLNENMSEYIERIVCSVLVVRWKFFGSLKSVITRFVWSAIIDPYGRYENVITGCKLTLNKRLAEYCPALEKFESGTCPSLEWLREQ